MHICPHIAANVCSRRLIDYWHGSLGSFYLASYHQFYSAQIRLNLI